MSRLTIEVDDALLEGLQRRAASAGCTVSSIVEEALRQQGAIVGAEPVDLLAKARRNAGLDEDEAMKLAVEETRKVREAWARKRS